MSLISPLMPVPQTYHYLCYIALPLPMMYAVNRNRLYFCMPTAQLKQLSMGFYKIYLVSTSEWWTRNFRDRRAHARHITDTEMRISR